MNDDAVNEAAFQMYWHFIRTPDEERARYRWSRLTHHAREEWLEYARRSHRVYEIHERTAA